MNPRIKAMKIMPLLRPLTQNGLLKAGDAKTLISEFMKNGDTGVLVNKIECIQMADEFVPLRGIIVENIKKEMEETK